MWLLPTNSIYFSCNSVTANKKCNLALGHLVTDDDTAWIEGWDLPPMQSVAEGAWGTPPMPTMLANGQSVAPMTTDSINFTNNLDEDRETG